MNSSRPADERWLPAAKVSGPISAGTSCRGTQTVTVRSVDSGQEYWSRCQVVMEADTAHLEQFGGDPGQPGRADEVLDHRAVPPQVFYLQERLTVGVTLG